MKRSGFRRPKVPSRPAFVPPARDMGDPVRVARQIVREVLAEPAVIAARACPKDVRVGDPRYLAFVRSESCIGCGKPGPNHAHHRHGEPGTLKGMNFKSDDTEAVPLCETIGTYYGCHDRWHREQRFEGKTKQETIEMMERARVELREEYLARTEGVF